MTEKKKNKRFSCEALAVWVASLAKGRAALAEFGRTADVEARQLLWKLSPTYAALHVSLAELTCGSPNARRKRWLSFASRRAGVGSERTCRTLSLGLPG